MDIGRLSRCFHADIESNGVYKNSYRWGSTLSDIGFAVAVPNYNSIYTGGRFDNTVDFDPGVGVANLTAGAYDVFVSKIDQCIPNDEFKHGYCFHAIITLLPVDMSIGEWHLYNDSAKQPRLRQHYHPAFDHQRTSSPARPHFSEPHHRRWNLEHLFGTCSAWCLSYTWTLPSGWSGSSTSNIIVTSPGPISGTISVTANDSCGASVARTWSITVRSIPVQPSFITGNGSVCEGSTQTYSVTPIPSATSYSWTSPSGWAGGSTGNRFECEYGCYRRHRYPFLLAIPGQFSRSDT